MHRGRSGGGSIRRRSYNLKATNCPQRLDDNSSDRAINDNDSRASDSANIRFPNAGFSNHINILLLSTRFRFAITIHIPLAMTSNEDPASSPRASANLEDLLYYKSQYEQLEAELADFQTSSRELEAELEKDVEASEKRERELKEKVESLCYEVDEWKVSLNVSILMISCSPAHSYVFKLTV